MCCSLISIKGNSGKIHLKKIKVATYWEWLGMGLKGWELE